jgi:hypothetical protein
MTQQVPNSMVAFDGGAFSFRNRLINGSMRMVQRATTYSLTTSWVYGSLDRWAFVQPTSANGVANQVAAGLTGFQSALKLGRNSGATQLGQLQMGQALESINSIPLQGQTVTLSFYAKAGANFSGANLVPTLYYGTGTDQSITIVGGWTGGTSVNFTQAITTSWARYSFTTTLPSTVTQLAVLIAYTPTGTAGADDNVYITGVQLEVGTVATPFEFLPFSTELALCQRYFCFGAGGTVVFNAGAYNSCQFPVFMRATPTVVVTPTTGTISGLSATPSGFLAANSAISGASYTASIEL